MKIIFFHSSMQAGGIERTISLLSELFVSKGDNVTIVTLDNCDSFYPLLSEVNHVKLGLMTDSKTKKEAIWNNFKRIKNLRKVLKNEHPDVIISFGTSTELVCFLARMGLEGKLVGAEQANPFLSANNIWNKNKRLIARLCDGYIFQTKGAAGYYPASVQRKGVIFQNGLKSDTFKLLDRNWNERENICAVGRMDAEKCFDDLLKAFSIVHKKHPDVRLNFYGDGPLRNSLQRLSVQLGLHDSVKFHGRCEGILKEYAAHRIFAMSSEQEGFPNVLMEALASGCACVSTDCDFGPSELIKDGVNGFLVPVHDPNAMADRICRLLEDDALCRKMSNSAISIRDTHDIDSIGASFRSYMSQL